MKTNLQKEYAGNPWIEKASWLKKTDVTYPVEFKGLKVNARMYDVEVTGYNNKTNKLHLFDLDSVDETIVKDGIEFDKEDIREESDIVPLSGRQRCSRDDCCGSISSTLW